MKFSNLGIGKRLGIAFGVILTVQVLFVVLVGYLNITNKNSLIEDINYINAKTINVTKMRASLSKISISIRNIGLQSDVELMKKEQLKVINTYKDYDSAHKKLLRLNLSEEELALMKDIDKKNEQSIKLFEEAMKNILSFDTEGAVKIISTKIDPLSEEMKVDINKIVEKEETALKTLLKSSVVDDNNLLIGLSICALLEVIIACLVAFIITRSITKPLNSAVKIANTVASGDLTQNIVVRSTDETGQLLQALQNMNTSLKKIVTEVRLGTDMISTASSEIASGNMDLSGRTEEQAGSLEETASSMEELTSTVKGNTANALEANKLAMQASNIAVKGGEVVSNVVTTMGSINDSSKKIVDIISVIDSIAFQTNILALNAAVEAARAGEQGRGFAVVASEVRNLAQRSAQAAKEIKELINDSVSKVTIGRQLVDQAGQTMNEIVTSVKHVTDIMGEITMASQEQEAGISQVNKAINQMDTVTQQNAALVEEAAAAAQSLNEQADNLSQVVSVFKV